MDIKHQFTRKSRVVEQTYDTKIAAQMANDNEGVSMMPDTMDYPIYLIGEMQCDISDGDTRQHIINKASVLCEYLTKDHWNARAKTKEGQNKYNIRDVESAMGVCTLTDTLKHEAQPECTDLRFTVYDKEQR